MSYNELLEGIRNVGNHYLKLKMVYIRDPKEAKCMRVDKLLHSLYIQNNEELNPKNADELLESVFSVKGNSETIVGVLCQEYEFGNNLTPIASAIINRKSDEQLIDTPFEFVMTNYKDIHTSVFGRYKSILQLNLMNEIDSSVYKPNSGIKIEHVEPRLHALETMKQLMSKNTEFTITRREKKEARPINNFLRYKVDGSDVWGILPQSLFNLVSKFVGNTWNLFDIEVVNDYEPVKCNRYKYKESIYHFKPILN